VQLHRQHRQPGRGATQGIRRNHQYSTSTRFISIVVIQLTLVQTCIAALYILVSVAYYWSEANLGLLVMAGADSLLLIAFIVVAVTVGKPVSYLNCYVIGKTSTEVDAAYAYAFTTSVKNNLNQMGDKLSLGHWAGVTRSNCFQAKTVWGLAIAMW
jgi:hypothetical protein